MRLDVLHECKPTLLDDCMRGHVTWLDINVELQIRATAVHVVLYDGAECENRCIMTVFADVVAPKSVLKI